MGTQNGQAKHGREMDKDATVRIVKMRKQGKEGKQVSCQACC